MLNSTQVPILNTFLRTDMQVCYHHLTDFYRPQSTNALEYVFVQMYNQQGRVPRGHEWLLWETASKRGIQRDKFIFLVFTYRVVFLVLARVEMTDVKHEILWLLGVHFREFVWNSSIWENRFLFKAFRNMDGSGIHLCEVKCVRDLWESNFFDASRGEFFSVKGFSWQKNLKKTHTWWLDLKLDISSLKYIFKIKTLSLNLSQILNSTESSRKV